MSEAKDFLSFGLPLLQLYRIYETGTAKRPTARKCNGKHEG